MKLDDVLYESRTAEDLRKIEVFIKNATEEARKQMEDEYEGYWLRQANDFLGYQKKTIAADPKMYNSRFWSKAYTEFFHSYPGYKTRVLSMLSQADNKDFDFNYGNITSPFKLRPNARSFAARHAKDDVTALFNDYRAKFAKKVSSFDGEIDKIAASEKFYRQGMGMHGRVHFSYKNGIQFTLYCFVTTKFAWKSGYFFHQYPFRFSDVTVDGKSVRANSFDAVAKLFADRAGQTFVSSREAEATKPMMRALPYMDFKAIYFDVKTREFKVVINGHPELYRSKYINEPAFKELLVKGIPNKERVPVVPKDVIFKYAYGGANPDVFLDIAKKMVRDARENQMKSPQELQALGMMNEQDALVIWRWAKNLSQELPKLRKWRKEKFN